MDLTEAQWQTVIRHTRAANSQSAGNRNPPNVVMLTLATVIGDVDQIVASHTSYKWDAPTVWSTWAFTTSGLAHVEATFAPECYDALEDRQRRQPGAGQQPVAPTAIFAWMRPLRTATSFGVTRVYHNSWTDQIGHHEHFAPGEIELSFGDTPERIGSGTWFDDEAKRARWEAFVAAARAAAITEGASA
jgi:hypothetical protein